jgi:hypothetical protein
MMHNHWSQTLETLIDWLALNDTLGDAVVVRRLMDVLERAPHPALLGGLHSIDAATVDRLLSADAADALVLRLIGAQSGFLASRGASGEHLVSVVLAGQATESSAAGATLARAVVCALALALSRPDHRDYTPEAAYAGLRSATATGATLH